ncbi:hypothetical protein BYT27DRAFT_7209875 [Phlegmacium glaucopus]|nr:hypothetical protein BYT27DRAFT_7209875 [Phlegmacium glaucopus]
METTVSSSSLPVTSTFSFKAPFPASSSSSHGVGTASALKHRRVSLASQSSPRVVQAWNFRDDTGLDSQAASSSTNGQLVPEKKGKMRKIDLSQDGDDPSRLEKKPRKKWSEEETRMLVEGCQTHGVGNWKTILQDPDLKFHDRSAVDLKDRFRTYFPDAYKKHYPNARTHLSSKVRSVLPDGSSLFVKTRGKRRRPFSEEEDRALKAGYEKHGTTWATIVKDPVFREQNRRSTDLRDRFRNAFPNLYQAAGYKPRSNKKKLDGPVRAATDDQLSMSTTSIGPIRPRRRAQTSQGLLRGGTKSVPQSTACSEDEDSSGAEDDAESPYVFKTPPTPIFVDTVSTLSSRIKKPAPKDVCILDDDDDDDDMAALYPLTDPLNIPDFLPSETHSDMETWSSGINTPTHSSHAWSTAAISPASSSNVSDYLMNSSSQSSPFLQRPLSEFIGGTNNNMIGKSAWGAHDWFSSNPRLDNSAGTASSSNSSSSFFGEGISSPASPYSFHPHGVVDRYDLFPSSIPSHISSEMGLGDSTGAGAAYFGFGSEEMMSGFKGYHSQIAGDLISGARTHQQSSSGFYGFGDFSGLGLSGVPHQQQHQQQQQQQQTASIHPMQLHTPSLLGIDELGLTGITLNDQVDPVVSSSSTAMDDRTADAVLAVFELTPEQKNLQQQQQEQQKNESDESSSMLSDRFSLDDLVDMSGELHTTPPATPLTQPRPLRRSSASMLHHYSDVGHHARSTSVPPIEARNGIEQLSSSSSSSSSAEMHIHSFFSHSHPPHPPSRSSTSRHRQPTSEPMRFSNSTGSISMQNSSSSTTNLFSDHLMLAVSPSSSSSSTSTTNNDIWRSVSVGTAGGDNNTITGDNNNHNDNNKNGKTTTTTGQNPPSPSLSSFMSSNTISPGDFYNLPFLDLHYYGHTYGSGTSMLGGHTPTMGSGMDLVHGGGGGGMGTAAEVARQGQALDLAQSAVLASSTTSTLTVGSTATMLGLKNGSGLEGLFNALRQQSHQPVTPTSTKIGQRATAPPTPLLPSASLHSPSSSPPPSPRTPQPGPSLVLAPSGGMGTIRQSHITNNNNGRSMSHHRGLSAVCPQDLVLRQDNNKRKRASWDGGVV